MSSSPQEVIDRVARKMGVDLPTLASRLGLEGRTLKRIRAGEYKLSETVRLHLQDLEVLYDQVVPKVGAVKRKAESPRRGREDTVEYGRKDDESLRLVIARLTEGFSVNDLAAMISKIADDQDLPSGLRTRVVKIISEFIPQRMTK